MSHPLQVYLDDSEFNTLTAWAQARGWTLSQAVRVALKALTRPAHEEDPLLAASGMIEGLPPDLSARFDAYLGLSYVAEPRVPYGQTKQKRRTRKPVRR
jgi:hypothetical protein